jgi:hypothetical protein
MCKKAVDASEEKEPEGPKQNNESTKEDDSTSQEQGAADQGQELQVCFVACCPFCYKTRPT